MYIILPKITMRYKVDIPGKKEYMYAHLLVMSVRARAPACIYKKAWFW